MYVYVAYKCRLFKCLWKFKDAKCLRLPNIHHKDNQKQLLYDKESQKKTQDKRCNNKGKSNLYGLPQESLSPRCPADLWPMSLDPVTLLHTKILECGCGGVCPAYGVSNESQRSMLIIFKSNSSSHGCWKFLLWVILFFFFLLWVMTQSCLLQWRHPLLLSHIPLNLYSNTGEMSTVTSSGGHICLLQIFRWLQIRCNHSLSIYFFSVVLYNHRTLCGSNYFYFVF